MHAAIEPVQPSFVAVEDKEMLNVNTHASNYPRPLLVDPNFYIGQLDRLTERFDTLIQKR